MNSECTKTELFASSGHHRSRHTAVLSAEPQHAHAHSSNGQRNGPQTAFQAD